MSAQSQRDLIMCGLAVGSVCGWLVGSSLGPDVPRGHDAGRHGGLLMIAFVVPFLGALFGAMAISPWRQKIEEFRQLAQEGAAHGAPPETKAAMVMLMLAPWAVASAVGLFAWYWPLLSVGVVWGAGHIACARAAEHASLRDPLLHSGAALAIASAAALAA